jgi:Protein of unknown function (DUF2637)
MAVTATNAQPARSPAEGGPPARQTTNRIPQPADDHLQARTRRGDRLVRQTTTASVVLLAAIAAAVSYRHMHTLVLRHGEAAWTAALLPLSVDGMIAASSMALLADSRHGSRGGALPWALLVIGSAASLAANVAVAEPTLIGRLIAAWPSCALIGSYELLMRQIRQSARQRPAAASAYAPKTPSPAADTDAEGPPAPPATATAVPAHASAASRRATTRQAATCGTGRASAPSDPHASAEGARPRQRRQTADLRLRAWQWALANRDAHGQLPAGKVIAAQFGRKERWGRLVKKAGLAGSLGFPNEPAEQSRAA